MNVSTASPEAGISVVTVVCCFMLVLLSLSLLHALWHTLKWVSVECLNVIFAFHHVTGKSGVEPATINSIKTKQSQLLYVSHSNLFLLCFLWWFCSPLPCIIVSHHWNHLPVLECNTNYCQGDKNVVHISFMWSLGIFRIYWTVTHGLNKTLNYLWTSLRSQYSQESFQLAFLIALWCFWWVWD